MNPGQRLVLWSVVVQSLGQVLYGARLGDVPAPLFILIGVGPMIATCMVSAGFRLPSRGRGLLLWANLWTAISFMGVFFALKHIPPATYAAFQIATSVLTAVILQCVAQRTAPPKSRLLVCAGIFGGCAVLAAVEARSSMLRGADLSVLAAIAASMVTGVTSTLTATLCKALAAQGWCSASVLGHRFYLTIAVAFLWWRMGGAGADAVAPTTLAVAAGVGVLCLLAPLLLQQFALRRTDTLTVMIGLAAQPIVSFLISIAAPVYGCNWMALIGVLTVTLFVGLDVFLQRAPRPRMALTVAVAR
jgi:drug/metabolite transporter (DMT)-like permease